MNTQSPHFGEQLALEFPLGAQAPQISLNSAPTARESAATAAATVPVDSFTPVRTVQDLLDVVSQSTTKGRAGMMRTAALHACEYLGLSIQDCPVDRLYSLSKGFLDYLRSRRFSKNSVRSYHTHIRMMLGTANRRGVMLLGEDQQRSLRQAWSKVLSCFKGTEFSSCKIVANYAISKGITPDNFHEPELLGWMQEALSAGRTKQYVLHTVRLFRMFASANPGLGLTGIDPARPRLVYGEKFNCLPDSLKNEIATILKWKQSRFAPGRSARQRHRPITAKALQDHLCRLYGFALAHCGFSAHSFCQLLTSSVLNRYCFWYLEERKCQSSSLNRMLGMLLTIAKHHPDYSKVDWNWFSDLLAQIPPDSPSTLRESRERKLLPKRVADAIPRKMREYSQRFTSDVEKARWCRNELLVRMLIFLAWRRRNLCECKIAPESDGGNIFKAPLPLGRPMTIPSSVEGVCNLLEGVWQYYFREDETKAKRSVRAALPMDIASLLEDYVVRHRPLLIHGLDPGTLFIDDSGRSFAPQQLTDLVGRLTKKFAGKRVTPHTFRSIFAVEYLRSNPSDYLTVQLHLWHSNLQTTLGIYGTGFNEADASRRVEEWRTRSERSIS